ncbi:hypothetical protein SASPL_126724 [Salvia splendens]|uniref:Uncharacterized protein n=1 Tax=Salvia splendens TaxID=180675 RepID=A0A8X8XI75_SALSN|nr:hypothetical protein SASPL_126724 [Salvia splendens]
MMSMLVLVLVLVLMLVATTVVEGAEDGNDMGKCLLECSEKVVMCAAKCHEFESSGCRIAHYGARMHGRSVAACGGPIPSRAMPNRMWREHDVVWGGLWSKERRNREPCLLPRLCHSGYSMPNILLWQANYSQIQV